MIIIEELLCGSDGRYSLRRTIAAVSALNFLFKSTVVIAAFVLNGITPPAEITMLLGLDIGLITACLGLSTWQNNVETKSKSTNGDNTPPSE